MDPLTFKLQVKAVGKWASESKVEALHLGIMRPRAVITYVGRIPKRTYDLRITEWAGIHLYSLRFIALLQACSFTGFRPFEASILDDDNEEVKRLPCCGLSVLGRCGPIDESLTRRVWVKRKALPDGGYWEGRGTYFRPDSWDGSDIFCPPETRITFVTRKVKDAVESARMTNVCFGSIESIITFPPSE
ncbi:MAG: hypothetical protein IT365_01040 [Candidatus Hydrogenedentes bacterium]|nr:hypothetical protein [Candidatus Hydrogenedentota bacterium]